MIIYETLLYVYILSILSTIEYKLDKRVLLLHIKSSAISVQICYQLLIM